MNLVKPDFTKVFFTLGEGKWLPGLHDDTGLGGIWFAYNETLTHQPMLWVKDFKERHDATAVDEIFDRIYDQFTLYEGKWVIGSRQEDEFLSCINESYIR